MSLAAKTDAAVRLIRRDILNGAFRPDEPLRLPALSARYALSATPLREALARLAEQGYVAQTANRGWRVAGVSVAAVEDLLAARLVIERTLLADSLAQGGIEWEAGIVAALHRLEAVAPPRPGGTAIDARQRWIAAHEAFHAALVGGGGPEALHRFRAQLAEQLERHHQAILFAPEAFGAPDRGAATEAHLAAATSVPLHAVLAEAALSRDPAAAEAALTAHVAHTQSAYRALADGLLRGERRA